MLEKRINGFTVIAHEHVPGVGYVILGARRTGPGTYEYVVSTLSNIDTDTSWGQGYYFPHDFKGASDFYAHKIGA